MTEVLLEELSSHDLEWIKATGRQRDIRAGSILIRQSHPSEFVYIVVGGELVATISRVSRGNTLGRAFAALEDDATLEQEIARFSGGELVGEMSCLNLPMSPIAIKAVENSVVLAIPRQNLLERLWEDVEFAARFYRAIAILLFSRFRRTIELYLRRPRGPIAGLHDVPVIFGELSDSDVDWMVGHGKLEEVSAGTLLIRADRAIEYLYILLQGKLSVLMGEAQPNRLSNIFTRLETEPSGIDEPLEREIGRVGRGEIVGETAFLETHLSVATYRATEHSIVLAIPRHLLFIKLQQDPAMSSRFYRVISLLLSGRLQGLIDRLGFGRSSYRIGQTLSADVEYEDELDLDAMDRLTLGGARFDWMLKQLQLHTR